MSVNEDLERLNQSVSTIKQRVEQIHDNVMTPKAIVTMSLKDKIEVALYSAAVIIVVVYILKTVFHL